MKAIVMRHPRPVALFGGGMLIVLAAAVIPLATLTHQNDAAVSGTPLTLAFGLVGLAVAIRQPRNPVGWCLLSAGVLAGLDNAASLYTVAHYVEHHQLPLPALAVLAQPSWAPAIVLFGVATQLFPDARLPRGRWRLVLWIYLGFGAVWTVGAFAIALNAVIGNHIAITSSGDLAQLDRPSGPTAWWGILQTLFFPLFGLMLVAWVVREAPAFRRSTGERRQQLVLLIAGGLITGVSGGITVTFSGRSGILGVLGIVGGVGLVALPLSVGVGILRFRLYEIDRLISRTISYTIVTGLLAGIFVGLVALTTRVLPISSPVGVAASTLAAATLFNPLRIRVQKLIDRHFNRARYDAETIVAAFSARLRDAIDPDTVRAELLHAVERTLQPTHATLWIRGSTAV
jgi:hypothetical protein